MPKSILSVVVTVKKYKEENFRNCLDSMLNQNYKYFSVIVLCNPSNMSNIIDMINKSYSAVLNTTVYGITNIEDHIDEIEFKIKKYKTDYCLFIDSNDTFANGLFTELNKVIDTYYQPNVLFIGMNNVKNSKVEYPCKFITQETCKSESGIEFIKRNVKNNTDFSFINLFCIKVKFLEDYTSEITAEPNYDIYFLLLLLFKTKVICSLPSKYYNMNLDQKFNYDTNAKTGIKIIENDLSSAPSVVGEVVDFLSMIKNINEADNNSFYDYYIELIQKRIEYLTKQLLELSQKIR